MEENTLHCKVTVRIMTDKKAFGPGVAALLRGVQEHHSLQGAARQMDMSYSKAWTIVNEAERIWGFPLITCRVGGRRGGGSALTAQGEEVLRRYDDMDAAVKQVAEEKFHELFGNDIMKTLQTGGKDE